MQVFRHGKNCVTAVDDVSMTLYEDEITVLMGPNGAGKSVLAELLIGIQLFSSITTVYRFIISCGSILFLAQLCIVVKSNYNNKHYIYSR